MPLARSDLGDRRRVDLVGEVDGADDCERFAGSVTNGVAYFDASAQP